MKKWHKTKRFRRLFKQSRMWYKNEARKEGIRHLRPDKSITDPIKLYTSINNQKLNR